MLRDILHDLRYAIRRLIQSPGFTLTAIVCLALAIGACTATFALINAVVLRPFPGRNPEQIVEIYTAHLKQGWTKMALPKSDFDQFRDQSNCFAATALSCGANFALSGSGDAVRVNATAVSANYFDLLGVRAAVGRTFVPGDEGGNAAMGVVLGHKLWQDRFFGDVKVIGQTIRLDDDTYTILGVLPKSFRLPNDVTELWTQLVLQPDHNGIASYHGQGHFTCLARLKSGFTALQAEQQVSGILKRMNASPYRQHEVFQGQTAKVRDPKEDAIAASASTLGVLSGSVLCVLLIACANVANLMLTRSTARRREFAIRAAVGADRSHLVQQVLTESVLLAIVASGIGLLLGIWGIDAVLAISPWRYANREDVTVDVRVLVFAIGVSLLTALLFGMVPAVKLSRKRLLDALKEGDHGSGSRQAQRMRHVLVSAEVAMTLILLVGMGLLYRSFDRLQRVDLGFRVQGLVAMDITLPETRYKTLAEVEQFWRQLLDQIRPQPGVADAAVIVPHGIGAAVDMPGVSHDKINSICSYYPVTGDYIGVMGIPILRGRALAPTDAAGTTPVAVVNPKFAAMFLPSRDPIGETVKFGGIGYRIVGLTENIRDSGPLTDRGPAAYVPMDQQGFAPRWLRLTVRAAKDGGTRPLFGQCRAALRAVDSSLAPTRIATMEEIMADRISTQRFNLVVMAIFAACATLLAIAGLYGVTSYNVSQRTHEIGIRVALGAETGDILHLVLKRALVFAAAGLVVGVGGSMVVTRFLQNLLYEVTPLDPAVLVTVTVGLLVVSIAAAFVPAWRAAKISPSDALRYE
jgi:putative ABC transport system permease protein